MSRSPQLGRSGALDSDLLAAVEAAVDRLNAQLPASIGGRRRYTTGNLLDGRYRQLPGHGTLYVVSFASMREQGRVETVRLMRRSGPLIVSADTSGRAQPVNVLVPYYFRQHAFGAFMANVERLMLDQHERLQLVVVFYWRGVPAMPRREVARDRARVAALLQRLNRRVGHFVAQLIEEQRPFSRGRALLRGAAAIAAAADSGDDDVLLFFCDVDMFFDTGALRRCRTNTSPGRSVYYPIVFSTFSPALRARAWGRRPVSLWNEHPVDPEVGYWRDFGYGMTCQYRSDFSRAAGDFLISDSWGGEDVQLFQHHLRSGIEIVRAPDPGLVHVYHRKTCDRQQLGDKYTSCLGSLLANEASMRTWARWVQRLKDQPEATSAMMMELGG